MTPLLRGALSAVAAAVLLALAAPTAAQAEAGFAERAGLGAGAGPRSAGSAGSAAGAGLAEGGGAVAVTLRGSDPLRPVMVLTNSGSAPCRVPVGPLGTIVLTGVEQGGTGVAPISAEASLDMLEILTSQLRSLRPGESVEVPLRVLEWGPTGHAIQTVAWSPTAGAFASFYPVAAEQPLKLTGDYAAPLVTPDGGDPMCPPATAAAAAAAGTISPSDAPGDTKTTPWMAVAIAIAVLVVIVVVVILIVVVRTKRRRSANAGDPGAAASSGSGPDVGGSPGIAPDAAASPSKGPDAAASATEGPRANAGIAPGRDSDAGAVKDADSSPGASAAPSTDTDSGTDKGPGSGSGAGPGAAAIVALVLVAGLLGAVSQPQPAAAKFNPASGLSKAFNACLAIFKQPGYDPAGIIPTLEGSGIQVDIQPGTENQDDYGNAEYGLSKSHMLITWNLNDNHQYAGSGGSADPCDSLYHELYHAYEHANGTYSYDQCVTNEDGATGLSKAEVRATRAQNKLRQKMGGPARSHYGNKKMPTGECLPPPDPGTCHDPERDKKIYKSFVPGLAPRVRLPIAAQGARAARDGCGDSNGDPHLRTFDGLRYDFMAAGEFVLARDGDAYEIQVRQQPYPGSRTVAVNTAVAMKVGADRVEVRLTPGGAVHLLVNGTVAPLAKAKLPGGGAIEVTAARQVLIGWPDRSVATISPIGPWGLRVAPEPAEAHDGKLEGLLGDLNGDRANDLRIRGGNTITQPAGFEALYPAFADSWRIDAKSSLFTYEAGRDTSSYVDRTFPERLDVNALPNRAAAEAVCRRFGVSDPEVLAACIMDVALTGQPDFAAIAAEGQFFAAGSAFAGTEWTVRITKPGDTATVEFDATAGQRVFIDAGGTLPDTCGILALRGPDGLLASGCIINGKGYIDGTTLPAAGKHSIVVDPTGSDTGEVRLTLISIADQSGAISVGGAEVTARVDKPGVISRFTFTATAGEKVFVDIPSSSLPDQCGILALRAPNSDVIAGGCIINGKGYIDGTTLPVSGTYTVVVDAQERYTGEARLRLTSAVDQRSTISVGGPPVTATIGQVGAVSIFTFTGTAGQTVALDGAGSTLPDQCGVLMLRGPDNTVHASGCIIAGTASIRAFTLPVSGTYTITLDPGDRATGTATFRLHT